MITDYGMSKRFKNVALTQRGSGYGNSNEPKLVREYAESTQQYIDEEIARMINDRYDIVKKRLSEKKVLLEYIAQRLLEKETIEEAEFKEIVDAESQLQKSSSKE